LSMAFLIGWCGVASCCSWFFGVSSGALPFVKLREI